MTEFGERILNGDHFVRKVMRTPRVFRSVKRMDFLERLASGLINRENGIEEFAFANCREWNSLFGRRLAARLRHRNRQAQNRDGCPPEFRPPLN